MMAGGYNRRNPAVKRIMHEVEELKEATEDYYAQPLEDNLFEWHFTIRGPPNTDFEGGIYHGRISLPSDYPMRPPTIIMMNASGRFSVNTKICLSISGHHPETWQPSWSIRTALLALIGFMPTHGLGALGSLDYSPEERKLLATKSQEWKCPECGSIASLLKPVPVQSSSDEMKSDESKEVRADNKQEVSADKKEVSVDDKQEVSADDKQEVSADDKQEVSADDKQEVSADDKKEVSVDDKQEVSADDKKEVSVDDKQEVSADDKEVSSDDKQEVSTDGKKEISSDDKQEVSADDKQEISADDKQKVDADDMQEVSANDKHEVADNKQKLKFYGGLDVSPNQAGEFKETSISSPQHIQKNAEDSNMNNKEITDSPTDDVKFGNVQESLIDSVAKLYPVGLPGWVPLPDMEEGSYETETDVGLHSSSGAYGRDENDNTQNDSVIIDDDHRMPYSNQDHPDTDGDLQSTINLISSTKSLMQGKESTFDRKDNTIHDVSLPQYESHSGVGSASVLEHSKQEMAFDMGNVDSDTKSFLPNKQEVGEDDKQEVKFGGDRYSGAPSTASTSYVMKENLVTADHPQGNSDTLLKDAEDPSDTQVLPQGHAQNNGGGDHADNLELPQNNDWWLQYGPMIIEAVMYGLASVLLSYMMEWLYNFINDLDRRYFK